MSLSQPDFRWINFKVFQSGRKSNTLPDGAPQDALNAQTFSQFRAYAEQQYPDNPDQQAVLVRQLQEQHYFQYMQQIYQQQVIANTINNLV